MSQASAEKDAEQVVITMKCFGPGCYGRGYTANVFDVRRDRKNHDNRDNHKSRKACSSARRRDAHANTA